MKTTTISTVEAVRDNISLSDLVLQRRAFEAVIWGMPAVNYQLLYQAMLRLKGADNQVVYWSRLPDWKNQTLTPNTGILYFFPFFNTRQTGPVVIEIPPADDGSITGTIMDAWQIALEDVGPAGVDKGAGGKYLILPPRYYDEIPDGYIALTSETYSGYAVLRSNPRSGLNEDIAKAVAYGKRIKIYPLKNNDAVTQTKFIDAINAVYDNTIPYDIRFFDSLNRFVQQEPWQERDKAMIDQLRSIGIEKGKPFNPDQQTITLLEYAVQEARGWLENRYEQLFARRYYDSGHWSFPVPEDVVEGLQTSYAKPGSYPVDARAVSFSFAYSSTKHPGAGQFYLMAIADSSGRPLDSRGSYRLIVPAGAPVSLYWSATVYDRSTHTLIRNLTCSSRSSQTPGLKKNTDGSVTLYFGPHPPGGKESNWIPVTGSPRFEVLFRFYGPETSLFDKTWILPDIERIK